MYPKIKKLPRKAHNTQGIDSIKVNDTFSCPEQRKRIVDDITVVIIKKFDVAEDSFGSNPNPANIGLIIIPPPIPIIGEMIPARIA